MSAYGRKQTVRFRPEPDVGLGQKASATHMSVLRRRDEHRANADTAYFPVLRPALIQKN
jgi:hypothetical protein